MKYFFYEVVLPVSLVVLMYFPGSVTLLRGESHLFEKVFSTGDLLSISVLILINGYVELDRAEREQGVDTFGVPKAIIVMSGIIVFTTYLFIKASVLHVDFETDPVAPYLTNYAWGSMGCLVYAALVGAFARFSTARLRRSGSDSVVRTGRRPSVSLSSS